MTLISIPEIYGLVGQSNMVGLDPASNALMTASSGVTLFGNDWVWKVATDPIDSSYNQVDGSSIDTNAGVCSAIPMANALVEAGRSEIVLVPCAKSATTIQQWTPANITYKTTTSYGQTTDIHPLERDNLFGSCIARLLAAQAQTGGRIAGIIHYQGEANAQSTKYAGFAQATNNVLDAFRGYLGRPDLPIYIVQLPVVKPTAYTQLYWDSIRAQQASIAVGDNHLVVAPDGPWTDSTKLHLSASTQTVLGQRLAAAILSVSVDGPICSP